MKITEEEIKKIFEPTPSAKLEDIRKVRREIKHSPKHRRRKRNSFLESILNFTMISGFTGCLLFLIIGWGGIYDQLKWMYYTDYFNKPIPVNVAKKTQTPIKTATPRPTPTPTPTPTPSATPTMVQLPIVQEDPNSPVGNYIKADKISLDAPIIWDVPEASMLDRLKEGVTHYQGTAHPGEGGNIFLVGHSSNYVWIKSNYNHVFALLNKLENQDKIEVRYGRRSYFYHVTNKMIIKPGEVEILQNTPRETLTLMTCWPIGTSLKRLIVQAEFDYSAK